MKKTTLLLSLLTLNILSAAVPVRWPVETSRLQNAVFEAYHGESIAFEATLKAYGTALQLSTNVPAALFYQTNGMENAWWQIPATVSNNVISATFAPSNDCGAANYDCFLGQTGSVYRAAFRLRFRHSPGATPNVIAKPVPVLDLANTTVINPPWPTDDTIAATVRLVIAQDGITAGLSTNEVKATISNTVTKAYIESTGFSSGLDTNAVKTIIAQETADTLKNHGNATITGDDWATVTLTVGGNDMATDPGRIFVSGSITDAGSISIGSGGLSSGDLAGGQLTLDDASCSYTNSLTPAEVTIGDLKVRQTLNAVKADVAALATTNAAITARLNGEDAALIVTNYNSSTKIASASLRAKLTENGESTWLDIWNELTRWNAFTGTNFNWSAWGGFHNWQTNIETTVANKSEREYAYFDGVTGEAAPEGFFWVGKPKVAIASGMTYNRYVTGFGETWVLESNGTVPHITDANTNGYFRISDIDGNTQFEICKGSSIIADAVPNSMTNDTVSGVIHYFVEYYITNATSAPICYASTNLNTSAYVAQGTSGCPANANWIGPTTVNGVSRYILEWWPAVASSKMFIYARCGTGSRSKIVQNADVEMSVLILNGTAYTLGTATIDGHTVLTLTPR